MSKFKIKNGKKYKKIDDGIISIRPQRAGLVTPLFCPVCNFVMNSASDVEAFEIAKCCDECYIKWAQARKKDWEEGWRPAKEEIEIEKEIRRKMNVKFHF